MPMNSDSDTGFSTGGLFLEALARRDFDGMAGCLAPDVRFRALLPPRDVDVTGPDATLAEFRRWYGSEDETFEIVDATVGDFGPASISGGAYACPPPTARARRGSSSNTRSRQSATGSRRSACSAPASSPPESTPAPLLRGVPAVVDVFLRRTCDDFQRRMFDECVHGRGRRGDVRRVDVELTGHAPGPVRRPPHGRALKQWLRSERGRSCYGSAKQQAVAMLEGDVRAPARQDG